MAPVVKEWPQTSMERIAYDAVRSVPVLEDNDRNRLGYHIFLFLKGEFPDVAEAVHIAQPRMHCSKEEAVRLISTALAEARNGEVS
ncbi:MAG: hypothetical protein RBU27_05855 [Bacteroidota bacterium]|jgi:hypothetical protein|nr:hypothetical protein [Bacteroidota bacterium]